MDAELFADLDLDRQAVRVPAGFAFDQLAAHGLVAREEVFDGPRQAVARVRQAVGGGGAFVEDEPLGSVLARWSSDFWKMSFSLPEFEDLTLF